MSETHRARRIGQSIAAVIAGLFVGIVITLGTDVVLHAVAVFPPWGASMVGFDMYLQSQIVTKSLEPAREIQMGLVPKEFPALPEFKEVDIFATIVPALEVGGDLHDFFPLNNHRICFIIGDVSDKGVPAALFMAMARTAFKMSAIASPESIGLTMGRVNQFLCESNPQQMFATALAGILDLRTGRVDYADAGHEPPFILQQDGAVRTVSKVGGPVLSFLPGHEFRGGTLHLNPGNALFTLYGWRNRSDEHQPPASRGGCD
jgi:serine phosphatase RsbU (regulator of sigma subunit)